MVYSQVEVADIVAHLRRTLLEFTIAAKDACPMAERARALQR